MLCMSEKSSNFAVQIVYGSRNQMKAYCSNMYRSEVGCVCTPVQGNAHRGEPPSIVGIEVRKGKAEKTPVLPLHRICRRLCNNV